MLDSLLNQTLDDIEIILVDDGSPDGIAEIYRVYGKRSRLRLVVRTRVWAWLEILGLKLRASMWL